MKRGSCKSLNTMPAAVKCEQLLFLAEKQRHTWNWKICEASGFRVTNRFLLWTLLSFTNITCLTIKSLLLSSQTTDFQNCSWRAFLCLQWNRSDSSHPGGCLSTNHSHFLLTLQIMLSSFRAMMITTWGAMVINLLIKSCQLRLAYLSNKWKQ